MPAAAPDFGGDPARLFAPVAEHVHLALAVSGGSDSIALMHLAAAWPRHPPLSVLTVDHGLRAEAAAEAQAVAQAAAELGLAHVTLRWQGEKPASGLQAAARQARYDLMCDWCRGNGATALLTAHTLDDQAETVLMRLSRTTSIDSLGGIPPHGAWQGVAIFRPLLGQRRQALRDWLAARGVTWTDDPSNDDPRFERVRIRRKLPQLTAAGITAERLAGLADVWRALSGEVWALAERWIATHVEVHREAYASLPLAPFSALPELAQSRVLGLLIARFGGGTRPEPAELDHLRRSLAAAGDRRTLGGAAIVRRKAALLVGREAGRMVRQDLVMPERGEADWDGRFRLAAPPGSVVRAAGKVPELARAPHVPAFVWASLPAVRVPSGAWSLALSPEAGVSARFVR